MADREGWVREIDNRNLARLAKLAGAPRASSAGLELHVQRGEQVERGQPLLTLHGESRGEMDYALTFASANPEIIKVTAT